jgi:hypothetical protein
MKAMSGNTLAFALSYKTPIDPICGAKGPKREYRQNYISIFSISWANARKIDRSVESM